MLGLSLSLWSSSALGGSPSRLFLITNGSAWIGYNGTWQGSVTPVGGSTTGRTTSFTGGMTVFPACNVYTTSNKVRLRTAAAELSYSPPSGFSAWDS